MKLKLILLILLVIYIIYYIYYKINTICDDVKYYIYDSNVKGKTIIILGGTHGDEPAGSYAIHNLMNDLNTKLKLKSGKLILIPDVNYCGLKLFNRNAPTVGDINRQYLVNSDDTNISKINQKIKSLINNADFVLDFHEAYIFNKKYPNSLGSTLLPCKTKLSMNIAKKIINDLNKTIKTDYKKFDIVNDNDINGTLRDYCNILNKNYILVETTGKEHIQPIKIRVKQDEIIINSLLKYMNII